MTKPTKEQIRKIIGKNIRRERLLRDISIEAFATMMGLTPGFIGLIERGQRGTTSSCIYQISKLFDISTDVLFENHEYDENELPEIYKEKALHEKISNLTLDFNQKELAYAANMLFTLRGLRELQTIEDSEDSNE